MCVWKREKREKSYFGVQYLQTRVALTMSALPNFIIKKRNFKRVESLVIIVFLFGMNDFYKILLKLVFNLCHVGGIYRIRRVVSSYRI